MVLKLILLCPEVSMKAGGNRHFVSHFHRVRKDCIFTSHFFPTLLRLCEKSRNLPNNSVLLSTSVRERFFSLLFCFVFTWTSVNEETKVVKVLEITHCWVLSHTCHIYINFFKAWVTTLKGGWENVRTEDREECSEILWSGCGMITVLMSS